MDGDSLYPVSDKRPDLGYPRIHLTLKFQLKRIADGLITDLLVKASTHLKMKHQATAAIPSDPAKAKAILAEIGVPIHQGSIDWLNRHTTTQTEEGASDAD